jgi:chromosome segregation ATPase
VTLKGKVAVEGAERVDAAEEKLRKSEKLCSALREEVDRLKIAIGDGERERLRAEVESTSKLLLTERKTHKELSERFFVLADKNKTEKEEREYFEGRTKVLETMREEYEAAKKTHAETITALAAATATMDSHNQLLMAEQDERKRVEKELADLKEDLKVKLEAARAATDEMTAHRNFFKKKVDSLSSNLEKMLRERNVDVERIQKSATESSTTASSSGASSTSGIGRGEMERDSLVREITELKKSKTESLSGNLILCTNSLPSSTNR